MKKVFAVILATALLINGMIYFSLSANAYSSEEITVYPYDLRLGDVDNNGEVNVDDACEIQRYLALFQTGKPSDIPERWYSDIMDIDRNGSASIFDVTVLQQYLADIDKSDLNINKVVYSRYQRLLRATESLSNDEVTYYDAVNSNVDLYLSASDSEVTKYCNEENLDKPLALELDIPPDAKTIYLIDTVSKSGSVHAVKSDCFFIKNLIPGRVYRYLITDSENRLIKLGECSAKGRLRMIDAGGNTFNIRDLGGWSCDGGTLKYGLIYRGCELNGNIYNISLSEEQKHFFSDLLGIRDEIDLRSDDEIAGADGVFGTKDDINSSALGNSTDYKRYTVAPYSAGINLNNPYQTEYYSSLIKRIVKDVSENKPSYIHCLVGADRTGTVCALIEALCGVSREDIEREYELTSFARGNIRKKSSEEWQSLIKYLNNMDGNSLRDKAVNYALKSGVTKSEINTLRKALIDGNPEII